MAQRGDELGGEEADHGLGKGAELLEVEEELAALAIVGDHVQLVGAGKGEGVVAYVDLPSGGGGILQRLLQGKVAPAQERRVDHLAVPPDQARNGHAKTHKAGRIGVCSKALRRRKDVRHHGLRVLKGVSHGVNLARDHAHRQVQQHGRDGSGVNFNPHIFCYDHFN